MLIAFPLGRVGQFKSLQIFSFITDLNHLLKLVCYGKKGLLSLVYYNRFQKMERWQIEKCLPGKLLIYFVAMCATDTRVHVHVHFVQGQNINSNFNLM